MAASSRTEDSMDNMMDLTLYGSPAPRCLQRSTSAKTRRPVQPPNTPKSVKERKPLKLPIEKILLLTERLENTKMEKIKLELSSRQIRLQENGEGVSARDEQRSLLHSGKESNEESELSPSTVDLSIDLSTVTNSDHESDTSIEDEDDFAPAPFALSRRPRSEYSTGTESPSRYVWHLNKIDNLPIASGESSETGYPTSGATKSAPCTDSCVTTNRSRDDRGKTCFRSRSADLIYKYVSTVNDKNQLTKYFRPCHVCKEACCVCPDVVPESSRSFSMRSVDCEAMKEVRADKMTETDPEITDFGDRPESPKSEFSNFLVERYLNKERGETFENNEPFDSGTSTLQLDDANDSDRSGKSGSKKSVPFSMMQLATAAQCARILANSLESVLEIVEGEQEECLKGKDLVKFKGEDLNQLFEALLSLKNHFSARESKEEEGKTATETPKWISFPETDEYQPATDISLRESSNDAFGREDSNNSDNPVTLTFEDDFNI
ncbi:UNVERIFIED_CONTAM: hypothetical protein PYX00_003953 [Menopon gallinae]|uniref:Uncharacterized protein n=1 Tax=Menopon gallinae TaxID=328185 RepID=A0AAW2I3S6_9NEOP